MQNEGFKPVNCSSRSVSFTHLTNLGMNAIIQYFNRHLFLSDNKNTIWQKKHYSLFAFIQFCNLLHIFTRWWTFSIFWPTINLYSKVRTLLFKVEYLTILRALLGFKLTFFRCYLFLQTSFTKQNKNCYIFDNIAIK